MTEAKEQRIYVVGIKQVDGSVKYRLIKAVTKNSAVRKAAEDTITVGLASQGDLVHLLGKGVMVEGPPPPQPDLLSQGT